jgi:hypothetical protein
VTSRMKEEGSIDPKDACFSRSQSCDERIVCISRFLELASAGLSELRNLAILSAAWLFVRGRVE